MIKKLLFRGFFISTLAATSCGGQRPISTAAPFLNATIAPATEESRLSTESPPGSPVPTASQTPKISDEPEPQDAFLPLPEEYRTHYRLDAQLDYRGHSLEVIEQISYTNTTPEILGKIPLVVEALRYPGTFQIGKIYDANGERILQSRIQGTTLTVALPSELKPGENTSISLSYSLKLLDINELPQLRPYPLGYNDLQANFGDWYPFIPPYQPAGGWLIHDPAVYGEHLAYDLADFEVAITLPEGQDNLVIAAAEPGTLEGSALQFQHLSRRNFAWSVSPHYEVMTQTVQIPGGSSVLAASYYFPFHAEAGMSLLDTTAQALTVYSRLFGPYPHESVAGVQADFIDGMEYDGLYFLSTDYYNWHKDEAEDFLKVLAAHETAHQWWMGIVGSDQALEPWLDEALCTYSELIFFEEVYPEAIDWWWTYRVNYYEPQGWVGMSIYDAPQVANQYRSYRDPVYLRGALFMQELRDTMGDEAFFAALREYARRFAYRQADAKDFIQILNNHSVQDLDPVLEKYLVKLGE